MPLPFLDLANPDFSTRASDVLKARADSWCAKTPFGFAVLRHNQAARILRDRRFRQGSHNWPRKLGLTGSFANFWTQSVISLEGANHRTLRQIAQSALAEDAVKALSPCFEKIAEKLATSLPTKIEFVSAFSEPFAGQAITTLLGVSSDQAAEIGRDASTLGLAMGLDGKSHETAVNDATDRLMKLSKDLLNSPPIGSFPSRLVDAATRLAFTDLSALQNLIVISIFGGVDTTRAQLAFLIGLMIDKPAVWSHLREKPEFIPNAIEEAIRIRPTTTWATREALEDVSIDGAEIAKGAIIHILVHATATDPLASGSGEFDPFAKRKPHHGFGGGAHHCLGHMVARTDMHCALKVLLDQVERFSWAGTPSYLPDSGNTSPSEMPVRLHRRAAL